MNLTVQAANLSLKDDLPNVQKAYDQLTAIEASEDLCEVLSFRNHMMFNRIVSVVLAKLQDLEQSPCSAYGGLTPEQVKLNFRLKRPQVLEKENGSVWVVSDWSSDSNRSHL